MIDFYKKCIGSQIVIDSTNYKYDGILIACAYDHAYKDCIAFYISNLATEAKNAPGIPITLDVLPRIIRIFSYDIISFSLKNAKTESEEFAAYVKSQVTYSKVTEANCRNCTRKNDCGISKCWNCEYPNPC